VRQEELIGTTGWRIAQVGVNLWKAQSALARSLLCIMHVSTCTCTCEVAPPSNPKSTDAECAPLCPECIALVLPDPNLLQDVLQEYT